MRSLGCSRACWPGLGLRQFLHLGLRQRLFMCDLFFRKHLEVNVEAGVHGLAEGGKLLFLQFELKPIGSTPDLPQVCHLADLKESLVLSCPVSLLNEMF